MYSKNCNSSVGAGVVSTLSQSESKTWELCTVTLELHITKQSWLGRILKTHSFLLSNPFRVHTANWHPLSTVSIRTYRAVAWQVVLLLEQSLGASRIRRIQQDRQRWVWRCPHDASVSRGQKCGQLFSLFLLSSLKGSFLTVSSASVFSLKSKLFTFFVQVLKKTMKSL